MTDMDLLDAVDDLTLPKHTKVIQPKFVTIMGADGRPKIDDEGNPRRKIDGTVTTRIRHEPLLTQLEAAIRGMLNQVEGSAASLAFTRGMIDSEALYHFTIIRNQIRDWARKVDSDITGDLTHILRAWYVKHTQQSEHSRWQTRKLRAWKQLIEDKLDPKQIMDLPGPCPNRECPQEYKPEFDLWFWWDPRSKEQAPRPLVVEYRAVDGPDMVKNATGRCRACGAVWSVRALAYDREHAGDPLPAIPEPESDTPVVNDTGVVSC